MSFLKYNKKTILKDYEYSDIFTYIQVEPVVIRQASKNRNCFICDLDNCIIDMNSAIKSQKLSPAMGDNFENVKKLISDLRSSKENYLCIMITCVSRLFEEEIESVLVENNIEYDYIATSDDVYFLDAHIAKRKIYEKKIAPRFNCVYVIDSDKEEKSKWYENYNMGIIICKQNKFNTKLNGSFLR